MELKKIVDVLNEAVKADAVEIRSMLCYQVPINETLANHETIQCREFECGYVLTFLGLLNGLVGNNEQMICTKWSDDANEFGEYKFLGFDVVKPVFRESDFE